MAFAKLKRPMDGHIWINEYGVILREPHETEWLPGGQYEGEVTVVEGAGGGGYIVRGAPEEIAQVIDFECGEE